MAGIIFEDTDKTDEEKYKTITDEEIDNIINKLTAKSLSSNRQRKNIITGIIASLKELKRQKNEYKKLSMKEQKTDFDLQHLEELDNKMKQIWLLYLRS